MDETPSLSYATTASTPGSWTIGSLNQLSSTLGLGAQAQLNKTAAQLNNTAANTYAITYTHQRKIMAKLIRYTVVNPNPLVLEHAPETAILLEGRGMMNGGDEKGFLLEVAPRILSALIEHNHVLNGLTYRDEDGKTQTFPPIKIAQLDVVVETVKSYEK